MAVLIGDGVWWHKSHTVINCEYSVTVHQQRQWFDRGAAISRVHNCFITDINITYVSVNQHASIKRLVCDVRVHFHFWAYAHTGHNQVK